MSRDSYVDFLHDTAGRGLKPAHIPSAEVTLPDEQLPRDPGLRATVLALLDPDHPQLPGDVGSHYADPADLAVDTDVPMPDGWAE